MVSVDERIGQNVGRQSRRGIKGTHKRGVRTSKNVGTKAFGGRESGQIFGCKANRLSSCTQRLLGTYGQAGQAKANINK